VTEQTADFSLDTAAVLAAETHGESIEAKSPWALAWRRLKRNKTALFFLGVFGLILLSCLLAPFYADHIAGTGPNTNHVREQVECNGQMVDVTSAGGFKTVNGERKFTPAGQPLGPQWFACGGKYVLGADQNGRDVAVRMLYGGVTSLKIGFTSAAICITFAIALALIAGYFGGSVDFIITRFFDLMFAFPILLLAIALGTSLSINGFHHGPIDLDPGSLIIPTLVIGFGLVPYIGRPLRGQILSVRQKEFIEAATAQGASSWRIMFVELLPNVASTVLVFFALVVANNILFEAALSFLGAGVQPPDPSWGTLIAEGQDRIVTAPWLALVPGIAMVLTVIAINIFGDGLRDALDPRAKVKVG
jgi:peptide/nickel transport system permease protein